MLIEPNIFHKSRMPLYLQVAKLMRQKVESQEWPFGAQIPTLDQLADEYEVSRITLRAALTQLENEGIVRRTRGLGTFVAKDLSAQRWFKLPNNFDELVDRVGNLKIRLLSIPHEETRLVPAMDFGIVGPAYEHMRRVHYYNDEPYCLIDLYIAKDIFDVDPEGFRLKPAIKQLVSMPDIKIANGRQIMRITICDEETAPHLDIGIGDPIADVCRTLLDEQDRIIYYAHIQYPAQMILIDVDLMQGAGPPPAGKKKKQRNKE